MCTVMFYPILFPLNMCSTLPILLLLPPPHQRHHEKRELRETRLSQRPQQHSASPQATGNRNGEPTYRGRNNRRRRWKDSVERINSNNRKDPSTQEDTIMGLRGLPLPGPGQSDKNTILHLSLDWAFFYYVVLHPIIIAQQGQGQRREEMYVLTGRVTGN